MVGGGSNVLLGANSQASTNTIQNAVALGANAKVAIDNAIVLGDPTNTSLAVGIGTDSPQFPLDMRGVIRLQNKGTIKFTHLLNPNLRNGATDQFLTVNEQGEMVLARYQLRITDVSQWSDNVFKPEYRLAPLSKVEQHIQQTGHLLGLPSASEMVDKGLDIAKMDAKLLEKIEELTLYAIDLKKENEQQWRAIQQQQAQIDDLKQAKQRLKKVKQLLQQLLVKSR